MGVIVPTFPEVLRCPLTGPPYSITVPGEDVQGHVAAQVVVAHCTTLGGALHPDCAAGPGTEEVGSSPLWVSVSSSVR